MKCQILFSGKNKKNISILSSAEAAQRMVKVKLKAVSDLELHLTQSHRALDKSSVQKLIPDYE